jgi:biotin carboxyl carrier protein
MGTKYEITINGKMYTVEVEDIAASSAHVVVNGERKAVEFREIVASAPIQISAPAPAAAAAPKPEAAPLAQLVLAPTAPVSGQGKAVSAPMPGKILSIKVKVGDKVSSGDIVCTLEAMKMEMPISAPADGSVQGIHVQVGDTVVYDAPLITIG